MINATANEILNSLIRSKKCQLMEARHKLSMYSDMVDRLESEISALENTSEIIIGDSCSKKSIIYKRNPDESAMDCYFSIGHRYHGMSITECKEESNDQ